MEEKLLEQQAVEKPPESQWNLGTASLLCCIAFEVLLFSGQFSIPVVQGVAVMFAGAELLLAILSFRRGGLTRKYAIYSILRYSIGVGPIAAL